MLERFLLMLGFIFVGVGTMLLLLFVGFSGDGYILLTVLCCLEDIVGYCMVLGSFWTSTILLYCEYDLEYL